MIKISGTPPSHFENGRKKMSKITWGAFEEWADSEEISPAFLLLYLDKNITTKTVPSFLRELNRESRISALEDLLENCLHPKQKDRYKKMLEDETKCIKIEHNFWEKQND